MGRAVLGILERQQAGRGEDLRAADDDRAVVQRRADHEDRGEQLRGQPAVHGYAGLGVVLQPGAPLDDDERAVARAADEERGTGQLVDDPIDLLGVARHEQPVQRPELSELAETPPELGLEHDEDREHGDGEERLEQQLRQGQLEQHRQAVDDDEHENAEEELDRTRAADEAEEVVDEHEDDRDVEDVVPAKGLTIEERADGVEELVHQTACARRSTSTARSGPPSTRPR